MHEFHINRRTFTKPDCLSYSNPVLLLYSDFTVYRLRGLQFTSRAEDETDHLEDVIGTYLLKLTSQHLSEEESARATEYMKLIGADDRTP